MTDTTRTLRILAIAAWSFASVAQADDWAMWGGSPDRNMVNEVETNIPIEWDVRTGKNIKWAADLGSQSYGNPTVSNGRVFVGTNNGAHRQPEATGDKGVVMCFDEETGEFLWQATHDKHPAGRVHDWPEQGICSSPAAEGDRVYYVNNLGQLVCADAEGFRDGENDGPYVEETLTSEIDADYVWILDMMQNLDVFPHNLATSSPVIVGDAIFLVSGNGVDEGHLVVPVPFAPDFLAVNKNTGELIWDFTGPGANILHGQWSSPAYGVIGGIAQAVFPGGDGWLYGLDAETGELLWKYDCNPKDSVWVLGGSGTRNNLIATPVIWNDKVFIAVGQDPEHGEGAGRLHCVDAAQRGDITESGRIWNNQEVKRTISTVAIKDDILYFCDLSGYFRAMDVNTGETLWTEDLMAAVWGSPYWVDGKVLIGDEDGDILMFEHGREKKRLYETNILSSSYSTPVAANGRLFVGSRNRLYCIEEGAQLDMEAAGGQAH